MTRGGLPSTAAHTRERVPGTALCARTTLVLFRARLALHEACDRLFDRAIQYAQEQGLLKPGALRVLVDTKPVIGRGAVEDTYNLLARSMDRLLWALAGAAGQPVADWAATHDLSAYVRQREQSLKGGAEMDWSDRRARQALLTEIVTAARRLLALAAECLPTLEAQATVTLRAESELLEALLAQDVTESPGDGGNPTVELRDGTVRDRRPSATDPDQRHGHKSASRRFTGHKPRVAVDAESQIILDIEVLACNVGDADAVLTQIEAVEKRTKPSPRR